MVGVSIGAPRLLSCFVMGSGEQLRQFSEQKKHNKLSLVLNVKQRPQPTRMACRRADFSRPWRAEARHTQGTRVSCFGVSLLNMDVRYQV